MTQKHILIAAAVVLGGLILIAAGGSFLPANYGTTQNFTPNRFALLSATVDVASQQQTGQSSNPRRALFRLDSTTGQVWVLQMTIAGAGNAAVISASWNPVAEPQASGN